jgi:hypothetical protein
MRLRIICFVLLMYSLDCLSQANENNPAGNSISNRSSSYFSEVVIGMAIPSGVFKGTDYQDYQSGFARSGGFLFAGYGKLYHNRFGFEVAATLSFFPLNDKIDEFKEVENSQEYIRGYSWWTISALIGPCVSLPVNRFSFDFRILGGVTNVIRPYFRNVYGNGTARLEETTGIGYAFGVLFGAGIEYSLSEKVGIRFSADYIYTSPYIKYQEIASVGQVYFDKDDIKYMQPVSSFNAGLGVILHLHN